MTDFIRIVPREVNRIDNLVHQMLDYGKPNPLVLKMENIYRVLDDTVDLLSNQFFKKNVIIHKDYSPKSSLTLLIDPIQMQQAFLNLLLNSVDAMPSGGTITIRTKKTRHHFCILFEDTGLGIPDKDIPHVFDPFFTKKDNGTGLGLSITQSVIKNHKGKISVKSMEGEGTTFTLEIPLKANSDGKLPEKP